MNDRADTLRELIRWAESQPERQKFREPLRAAIAALEAAPSVSEVACPECGGSGYDAEFYVVPRCCGRATPHGDCCGNPEPEMEPRPCRMCGGHGRVEPAPVSEPAASDLPIPGEIGSKLVDAASGGKTSLVNRAIEQLRAMEPWDGKTFNPDLSATLRELMNTPDAASGEVDAVFSFMAEWHADVIRCLEDVSTEMRARGRGDERFQRLVHRMPASVIEKVRRLTTTGQSLDELAQQMADNYPILAIIRALDKAAPGIRGAFAPPKAATTGQDPA